MYKIAKTVFSQSLLLTFNQDLLKMHTNKDVVSYFQLDNLTITNSKNIVLTAPKKTCPSSMFGL